MTRPLITDAEFVLSDGHSRLVMERDPDGRVRIGVFSREGDGFAMTVGRTEKDPVAAFIKGDQ